MQVGAELFDGWGGVGPGVGCGTGPSEEIEQGCSTRTESPKAENPASKTTIILLIIVDRMKSCKTRSVTSG
jgi:hypothetical protein